MSADLTFEKSLEKLGVKKAFDALLQNNISTDRLQYWLRDIVAASDKYRPRRDDRRKAAQLALAARELATSIQRAIDKPPLWFFGSSDELQEMLALPKRLNKYAALWERLLKRRRVGGNAGPKSERIAALLEIVNKETGSPHYREVADLLNVMEQAVHRHESELKWTESKLAELLYRSRRRMRPLMRKT